MIPLVTAEDRSYDIRAKPIVGGGHHVVYLQFPPSLNIVSFGINACIKFFLSYHHENDLVVRSSRDEWPAPFYASLSLRPPFSPDRLQSSLSWLVRLTIHVFSFLLVSSRPITCLLQM